MSERRCVEKNTVLPSAATSPTSTFKKARHRVEPGGRLAQDQQLGVATEREAELELRPLTLRELADLRPRPNPEDAEVALHERLVPAPAQIPTERTDLGTVMPP
jgi:hypothetical protein